MLTATFDVTSSIYVRVALSSNLGLVTACHD